MPVHPPPPHLNPLRLKTSLKMAISKLKFIQDKKSAMTKQQRRQLADLLHQGKESSAQIRVENIIRDDIYIELLEYLELYCELLLARITILLDTNRSTIDPSLVEATHSIVYAAPHTELKELTGIRDILVYKFGQEFLASAVENSQNTVPEKITKRCLVNPPSETLVNLYLCEIAKTYNAPYSGLAEFELAEKEAENNSQDDDDENPSGGVGVKNLEEPIAVESGVSTEKTSSIESKPKGKQELDDFNSLKARFAALKGSK